MRVQRVLLLCMLAGIGHSASASVVSRLGAVYFYDPLTFDAGMLQRGAAIQLSADTDSMKLEAALDLPFYHMLSVQLTATQNTYWESQNEYEWRWRIRMPILESASFGRLSTVQFNYLGKLNNLASDTLLPHHEFNGAYSASTSLRHLAQSGHLQLGIIARSPASSRSAPTQTQRDEFQLGSSFRLAHLIQLYRPGSGLRGQWTVTVSTLEVQAFHYGFSARLPFEGRFRLSMAAPALHFTPRRATITLAMAPYVQTQYGAKAALDWGGMASLSVFYRNSLE